MPTAILLAGGRSSRMGRPKALLPFADQPLIVHIVRSLQRLFVDVVVVAAPGQALPPMPATVVYDEVVDQGPVGGIYYGLQAAPGDLAFITSCDAAFLSVPLISYLMSLCDGYDAVVPRWDDRFQPLFAAYRKTVLPVLEGQLAAGDLRLVRVVEKVNTRVVGEHEIRRFDPDGASFFNMNRPEDYQEALRRWPSRTDVG